MQTSGGIGVNVGASTSSGVTADMLEEPQRQDSALHPLIEARRAVLQDLAINPSRPSTSTAIPRTTSGMSHNDDELSPSGRVDSALDTLAAARSSVRASVIAGHDSPAPGGSGVSQWPEQASGAAAQAGASSPGGLIAEGSSPTWGSAPGTPANVVLRHNCIKV